MFANQKTRSLIRKVVPAPIINLYWKIQRPRNRNRSAQEVFTEVYERNLWGGVPGEYCSGAGSNEAHADAYARVVTDFIKSKAIRSVVDLGCGDFAIGKKLQVEGVTYTGIDVVEGLITRNRELYARPGISFQCMDITKDEPPDADLCLIRQVLQHLSNAQIAAILATTEKYRYLIVTEHYPAPSIDPTPNKDKPHGGDTRIIDDSAVYLDMPPFNQPVSHVMLKVDAGYWLVRPGETLQTLLVERS